MGDGLSPPGSGIRPGSFDAVGLPNGRLRPQTYGVLARPPAATDEDVNRAGTCLTMSTTQAKQLMVSLNQIRLRDRRGRPTFSGV